MLVYVHRQNLMQSVGQLECLSTTIPNKQLHQHSSTTAILLNYFDLGTVTMCVNLKWSAEWHSSCSQLCWQHTCICCPSDGRRNRHHGGQSTGWQPQKLPFLWYIFVTLYALHQGVHSKLMFVDVQCALENTLA